MSRNHDTLWCINEILNDLSFTPSSWVSPITPHQVQICPRAVDYQGFGDNLRPPENTFGLQVLALHSAGTTSQLYNTENAI